MTNKDELQKIDVDEIENAGQGHSSRIETAAYLAGISAFVGFCTLPKDASLGTGLAFVGIAGMVAVVCHFILQCTRQ